MYRAYPHHDASHKLIRVQKADLCPAADTPRNLDFLSHACQGNPRNIDRSVYFILLDIFFLYIILIYTVQKIVRLLFVARRRKVTYSVTKFRREADATQYQMDFSFERESVTRLLLFF
jgi:hypothetical protein